MGLPEYGVDGKRLSVAMPGGTTPTEILGARAK
jgi:hypothetical protein